MNRFVLRVLTLLLVLFVFSCKTDYAGSEPKNETINIAFNSYNQGEMYLTRKKVRVSWYGNDRDGYNANYYWVASADTSIDATNVLSRISLDKWNKTKNLYADIAFDYQGDRDSIFENSATKEKIRYVFSRLYLIAEDEDGNRTKVISREFWRTNTPPNTPTVQCPDWGLLPGEFAFSFYQGSSSPHMFMARESEYWKPVLFRWYSDDLDGGVSDKVELKYRWEVRKIITKESINLGKLQNIADNGVSAEANRVLIEAYKDTLISASADWDANLTSVYLSNEVAKGGAGYYKFVVYVKDDGGELSVHPTTTVFESFEPNFSKGVMLYDFTEPKSSGLSLSKGYPHKDSVAAFYKDALKNAGFEESTSEKLSSFRYVNNSSKQDSILVTDNLLREMLSYRMVIVVDEDHQDKLGIYSMSQTARGLVFAEYLKMGGKMLFVGNNPFRSTKMGTLFSLPTKYEATIPPFIEEYVGVNRVTEGSGIVVTVGNKNRDNYDFIGTVIYSHVKDKDRFAEMKVDPVKVNKYWKQADIDSYSIKGGGIFLPDQATIGANKGEIFMGYKSVFDDAELSKNAELIHTFSADSVAGSKRDKLILNRNQYDGMLSGQYSAMATRYIPNNDQYRTAYMGIPLFFMERQSAFKNLKGIIEWFDVNQKPSILRVDQLSREK